MRWDTKGIEIGPGANGIIPCAVQYARRDVIATNKTIESEVVDQNRIKF